MRDDERGYIVVETLGSFLPFVLLVVSILSLVNIVALQSRVHYALTQAAGTLSIYSYSLEATGVAGGLVNLNKHANKADIDEVIDGILSLKSPEVAVRRLYDRGEEIVENPKEMLQLIMNYGLDKGRNALIADQVMRPLVGRYLSNGDMTGDQYLKSVNVIDGLRGLDFHGGFFGAGSQDSILIDENENVRLVVHYETEYKFGALPLPFQPKLKIAQTVQTKAWLKGSGKGYW